MFREDVDLETLRAELRAIAGTEEGGYLHKYPSAAGTLWAHTHQKQAREILRIANDPNLDLDLENIIIRVSAIINGFKANGELRRNIGAILWNCFNQDYQEKANMLSNADYQGAVTIVKYSHGYGPSMPPTDNAHKVKLILAEESKYEHIELVAYR